jgi:predicted esterase
MIDPIMTAVKGALAENSNRVLVVGHSQGGAIATMVSTSLSGGKDSPQSDGAPCPGNKQ